MTDDHHMPFDLDVPDPSAPPLDAVEPPEATAPGLGALGAPDSLTDIDGGYAAADTWSLAAPLVDCCCSPGDAAAEAGGLAPQESAPTLTFPDVTGATMLPAEDSTGDGVVDRIVLDFNQDGVADGWAYDQHGTGQVDLLLIDTTASGTPDSVTTWTGTGWTPLQLLAAADPQPDAGTTQPQAGHAAGSTYAPVFEDPYAPAASDPYAPAATDPYAPAASQTDPWQERRESTTRDDDGDGRANAFDARPDEAFDSSSRDRDLDGVNDRFDNEPTRPFTSTTRDSDNDDRADAYDSSPRSYDRDDE